MFILCPQAQQQQLERAEGAFQRSAGRLREMQQHLAAQGGGEAGDAADGSRVLEVLQEDVARLRMQVRACAFTATVGCLCMRLACKLQGSFTSYPEQHVGRDVPSAVMTTVRMQLGPCWLAC